MPLSVRSNTDKNLGVHSTATNRTLIARAWGRRSGSAKGGCSYPWSPRTSTWRLKIAALIAMQLSLAGCVNSEGRVAPRDRIIAAAAEPLLRLEADAVWTDAYNRLLEHGSDSIHWLLRQPAMRNQASPDDLDTLLHTSLIRILAGRSGPELRFRAYETTLDLLYFDPRVDGRPLGEICIPPNAVLTQWHDAFPHRIDRGLARQIDAEAERQTVLAWWANGNSAPIAPPPPLAPDPERLWPLLTRRLADVWQYDVDRRPVLVSAGGQRGGNALLEIPTRDYNLVRAACIWLGTRGDEPTQRRLMDLINNPRVVVSHNALFALRFSPDPRVRETIERYGRGAATPASCEIPALQSD